MQILSVALTNFKTHKAQTFEFELGTNAICGENGAGKTSILEAIAWVLFNYQGSYRKEDLIRNGASSAQVRVTFISSRDGRTYEVLRSTTHNYTLYDPQLDEKLSLSRTRDEVLPWLRQHLGVAPGTDLAQLFANTIGVPQGTFTADFLLSAEKRKPIFDTTLKVEEYRETFKQTNSLRKLAEAKVDQLKTQIEQYDEALSGWEELNNRYQQLQTEINQGNEQLVRLEKQIQATDKTRTMLAAQAEQIRTTELQLGTLAQQIASERRALDRLKLDLANAQSAADTCKAVKVDYEAFLAAEHALKALYPRQKERQQLLQQQQTCQKQLATTQQDLARLESRLEQFKQDEKELDALADTALQQTKLEATQKEQQQVVQAFSTLRFKQETLTQQSQQLTQDIQAIAADISRLQKLKATCEQIPQWEAEQTRKQEQLSRIQAAQQFQAELDALTQKNQTQQNTYREQVKAALGILEGWKQRFEPIDDDAIAPIKDTLFQGGILSKQTLDTLNIILSDLAAQTDVATLQQQRARLQQQLKAAYTHRGEVQQLPHQETRQQQLKQQQQTLTQQLADVAQQLSKETASQAALTDISQQIQQLGNPKAKQQIILRSLKEKNAVLQQHHTLTASRQTTVEQLEQIGAQLQDFAKLDQQITEQQTKRQTHQDNYQRYLQNEQSAKQLATLNKELTETQQRSNELANQQTQLQATLKPLVESFDAAAFTQAEAQHKDLMSQADRLKGSLPQLQTRLSDLQQQQQQLQNTAAKREQAALDLKERERTKRFINYARKVYKAAGPKITERYVHSISKEADQLFRELLGRANVALTWSADYEITVQEGAHPRRFINLSGGEQMCAALAVRLAMLKVLADIDVAFFDEPTTNMDQARRTALAEAIARIRSFNQLFVISHDDTFEQVTDSVITVKREN